MSIELLVPSVTRRKVAYPALKPGSPEWKAKRPTLLGASEVPAIYGVELGGDHYKSAFTIHLEKTGKHTEEPRDPTSPAAIGGYVEHPIAEMYLASGVGGAGLIQKAWTEHHDDIPFFCATPDFDCFVDAHDQNRSHSLQCKNRGGLPKGWGDVGTDQVPRDVLIQVHAELAVTRNPYHDVAALLRGNTFVWYRIHFDASLSSHIENFVSEWWKKHVIDGVQPEIKGPGAAEYFATKYARATTDIVRTDLSEAEIAALGKAFRLREAVRVAELEYADAAAECMSYIGENRGLEADSVRALWNNMPGKKTISEASLREALNTLALEKSLTAPVEQVIAAATKIGKPFRQFVVSGVKVS